MDAHENVTLSGSGLRHRRGAGGIITPGRAERDKTTVEEPRLLGTESREGQEQGDQDQGRSEGPDLDGEGQGSEAKGRQAEQADDGRESESREQSVGEEAAEEQTGENKTEGAEDEPVLLSYEEYRAEVVRRRLAARKRRAKMRRPRGMQNSRGRLLYVAFLAFATVAFLYMRSRSALPSLPASPAVPPAIWGIERKLGSVSQTPDAPSAAPLLMVLDGAC